jgi:hypothetical protein
MIRAKPRDVPDLHGFEGIRGGRWMNAMNTWGGNAGIQHTHAHNSSFPSLARNTNSIEVARKDLPVEVPQRDRLIEAREI